MAELIKFEELVAKLRSRAALAAQNKGSVIVGYSAKYAIYVHENLQMKLKGQPRPSGLGNYWGPHGQAKFLEAPARQLVPELRRIIVQGLKRGIGMVQSLVLAGLRLQRESQKLVPVEYGNLKASAFTRVEK